MRRRDLNRLDYDFRARKGRLYMPPHSTCDMKGCLDLFLCIDPEVGRIETFAGDEPDTIYEQVHGEWYAQIAR